MWAGFSTHPDVPTNSASFNCIPMSYFCQFRQTICEPFCHWVKGFWLPEVTRRPLGYTLLRCPRECDIKCFRECGNRESIPDSEMLTITGTGYSDPVGLVMYRILPLLESAYFGCASPFQVSCFSCKVQEQQGGQIFLLSPADCLSNVFSPQAY